MSKSKNTAEIKNIHTNIMGTCSFNLRASGMRKFQDFSVYPIDSDTEFVKIQSSTRIGKLYLETGEIHMSKSHQSGAFFHHLSLDPITISQLTQLDLQALKLHIATTTGSKVGEAGIVCNNSKAINILDL